MLGLWPLISQHMLMTKLQKHTDSFLPCRCSKVSSAVLQGRRNKELVILCGSDVALNSYHCLMEKVKVFAEASHLRVRENKSVFGVWGICRCSLQVDHRNNGRQ